MPLDKDLILRKTMHMDIKEATGSGRWKDWQRLFALLTTHLVSLAPLEPARHATHLDPSSRDRRRPVGSPSSSSILPRFQEEAGVLMSVLPSQGIPLLSPPSSPLRR
jgi:hypothetical protein